MKNLLLLLFNVVMISFAGAQITGKVTNLDSNEPLIGAAILDVSSGKGTVTDINGMYTLNVEDGEHNIKVSYVGFTDITRSVSVN